MGYDEQRDRPVAAANELADGADGLMVKQGDKVLVYGSREQVNELLATRANEEWECVLNYG